MANWITMRLRTLSLVGLMLSCSLWALGYTRINCFSDTFEFDLADGAISFEHVPAGDERFGAVWSWSGFRTEHLRYLSLQPIFRLHSWPDGFWEVRIPLWIPALIFALVLSRPIRTWRRLRKSAADGLIRGLVVLVRRLATIVCAFGFVISLGLLALSRWGIAWYPPSGQSSVGLERGAIFVSWTAEDRYYPLPDNALSLSLGRWTRWPGPGITVGRFRTVHTRWLPKVGGFTFGSMRMTNVTMPLWIPLILFAVLPSYALLRCHYRRKRRRPGLCVNCGYNLRGLTEPRCPECGTPFEKP